MINNSPFDDHIKKQFGNYQPEVPPHIWENIMAEKEKRKPAGFLFGLSGKKVLLIAAVLVAATAGVLFLNNSFFNHKNTDHSPEKTANTNAPAQDKIVNNNTSNNTDKSSNDTKKEKNNNINSTDDITANDKLNSTTEKVKDVKSSNGSDQNSTNDLTTNNKTNSTTEKGREIKNSNDPALNNTDNTDKVNSVVYKSNKKKGSVIAAEEKINDQQNNKVGTTSINSTPNDAAVVANAQNNTDNNYNNQRRNKVKKATGKALLSVEKPGTENEATADGIAKNTETAIDGSITSINNNEFSLHNRFLSLGSLADEKTFDFNVRNIGLGALSIPCPGSGPANRQYFEIYGGPDFVFRSFEDTANSTYMQKRKESTSITSAFSFGVRFTKVFRNAVSFRTGINYSQVNEKFKFEQGNIIQLVYMTDANGDTTGSYGTTSSRYKTTHNRYRTIDIPILMGYEIGNGRLHANMNAGIVVNAYSWQKGDVLDSTYQPVSITTGKSANSPYQFKTNAGIGFIGGVSVYYQIGKKLHILAEPYFRYNFSAANKSDITLKQKYTTSGLRIGLRMDF